MIGSYLSAEQSPADRRRKARGLFVGYTLLIYLLTVGVAVGVDDVEVVFNSIGAVCSTSIAILLPCYFYCRLVVLRGQPKTVRFYLSMVVFAVMAPYAIFSVIALHVASE